MPHMSKSVREDSTGEQGVLLRGILFLFWGKVEIYG